MPDVAPREAYSTTYDDDLEAAPAHPVRQRDSPATPMRTHVPGEVGIWVFIFGDMLAFALFFAVFVVERGGDPALFEESRQSLGVGFAVVNTVLLLTSSLFVAMAVGALRTGARHLAPRLLALAFACGLAFVASKGLEYSDKLAAGITPATNDFFMFFFMLTGIHLLHVIIGLVVLGYLWRLVRRTRERSDDIRHVETGASYWHMVDLLWIVLFPLLYLMG